MKRTRLIGVSLVGVMLALPAAAITECWCPVGGGASSCLHSAPSGGDGCCRTPTVDDSCCEQGEPDGWEARCSCSARAATDAVLPADSKDRVGVSVASLPLDTADGPPALSVSPHSGSDRPPASHSRRQATLCVWRE